MNFTFAEIAIESLWINNKDPNSLNRTIKRALWEVYIRMTESFRTEELFFMMKKIGLDWTCS